MLNRILAVKDPGGDMQDRIMKVEPWDDDASCPKCGRTKTNDGLSFRILVDYDVLMMLCSRCGYEWFMETFPE